MPPTSIAVVGGGITGLSSAFHLSRRFPQAQIRVFEKLRREGGWIRSQRVDVQGYNGEKASVLLESGPRTLRPNSGAVLELVRTSVVHETPGLSCMCCRIISCVKVTLIARKAEGCLLSRSLRLLVGTNSHLEVG